MSGTYDVAIVGAGIIGLAHAYHLAQRGLRVIVFERQPRAQGASVRNFGMLWPVGQPAGAPYELALRSLEVWQQVLSASGLWQNHCGSLHVAYREDEAQVLREFAAEGRPGELLTPQQVVSRCPVIVATNLCAGWYSPTEINVDPRQVIAALPSWLQTTYGVTFKFDTAVLAYDLPHVVTTAGAVQVDELVICTGRDFRELAPQAFANSGLVPCKLQMLRSQPYGEHFRLGPMLAAGLTLGHYKAFAECPSLPALVARFQSEMPDYAHYGIHVMAAQNAAGELILGDSHEYGADITPFDNPVIDELILRYLSTFLMPPELRIAARWHGVYAKHPTELAVIARVAPGVLAVTGLGGAGMTLSFGLAEQVVNTHFGVNR